jgi:hypothetical protein
LFQRDDYTRSRPDGLCLESIADLLEEKLSQTRGQAGAPPQSHDLRSGNVP